MRSFHYTLLLAFSLVALSFVIVFNPKTPSASAEVEAKVLSPTSSPRLKRPPRATPGPLTAAVINLPDIPAPTAPPAALDHAGGREWITSQVFEMERLAWFNDSESLTKILAELKSPIPEIREAALNATVTSGSRAAIPHLRQVAAETQDPGQRIAIDEAIAYLNLPTLAESYDQEAHEQGASATPKTKRPTKSPR